MNHFTSITPPVFLRWYLSYYALGMFVILKKSFIHAIQPREQLPCVLCLHRNDNLLSSMHITSSQDLILLENSVRWNYLNESNIFVQCCLLFYFYPLVICVEQFLCMLHFGSLQLQLYKTFRFRRSRLAHGMAPLWFSINSCTPCNWSRKEIQ